jgi:hypothetical protein
MHSFSHHIGIPKNPERKAYTLSTHPEKIQQQNIASAWDKSGAPSFQMIFNINIRFFTLCLHFRHYQVVVCFFYVSAYTHQIKRVSTLCFLWFSFFQPFNFSRVFLLVYLHFPFLILFLFPLFFLLCFFNLFLILRSLSKVLNFFFLLYFTFLLISLLFQFFLFILHFALLF